MPFHPYYTVKDLFYLSLFVLLYAIVVFYLPNLLVEPDNYVPANPLVTPPEIVPEWYLLPFYAMLRSIPQKLIGVLVLFGALGTLVFVPWLDTSRVRSMRFRPLAKQFFWALVFDCILLGYLGAHRPDATFFGSGIPMLPFARLGTLYYYVYFWVILPLLGLLETPRPLPATIATSVIGSGVEQVNAPAE